MPIVTPGPGAYIAPSAFGVYVGERALISGDAQRHSTSVPKMRTPITGLKKSNGFDDVKKLINHTFQGNHQRGESASRIKQSASGDLKQSPIFYTGYSNRLAQQAGQKPLTENLTVMEKKILKRLKETARGKANI